MGNTSSANMYHTDKNIKNIDEIFDSKTIVNINSLADFVKTADSDNNKIYVWHHDVKLTSDNLSNACTYDGDIYYTYNIYNTRYIRNISADGVKVVINGKLFTPGTTTFIKPIHQGLTLAFPRDNAELSYDEILLNGEYDHMLVQIPLKNSKNIYYVDINAQFASDTIFG
jgi:hypothetical protein